MNSHAAKLIYLLLVALSPSLSQLKVQAHPTGALLASLLSATPGRQQQQQHQQLAQPSNYQQAPVYPVANAATSLNLNQSSFDQVTNNATVLHLQPQPLVQQFGALQAQAQRQFNQLVNSPIASNLTAVGAKYASNALEVLSNVGKAIQQQIAAASNHHQIQVMAPTVPDAINMPDKAETNRFVDANTKKNEYQSIQLVESGQQAVSGNNASSTPLGNNYREQGEQLRIEIARRVGQLQQVVASSMDMMKNNGDLIVRRLLEQLNHRLDQAKSKADKIISEPATNEVAIKALVTVNQGLNNLNNIITNIVNRLEASAKENNATNNQQISQVQAGSAAQRVSSNSLFEASRFKLNFHQLGQQFSSALSSIQKQQYQISAATTPGSMSTSLKQQTPSLIAATVNQVAKNSE